MRAPPESLIPMTGQPILAARSMILHIFSAITSPSEPPNTVKSCEKTQTGRPSIVPWPVTTASPQGRFFCMSKSAVRWRTKVSSSWKLPGSSSFSTRSRAVILPRACCFSSACGFVCIACSRSSWSWASFSSYVSGDFWRIGRGIVPARRSRARLAAREGAVVRLAERLERAVEDLLDLLGGGVWKRLGLRQGGLHDRLLRQGLTATEQPAREEALLGLDGDRLGVARPGVVRLQ